MQCVALQDARADQLESVKGSHGRFGRYRPPFPERLSAPHRGERIPNVGKAKPPRHEAQGQTIKNPASAGRERMGNGSVGRDQPVFFVDHAFTAAAGDGTPCEMVNTGDCFAVWAGDQTPIASGSGVTVDGRRCHLAASAIA